MYELIIFIISALVLFISFLMLKSMPAIPPRTKKSSEDYFLDLTGRIAGITSNEDISNAELSRKLFEQKFASTPNVKRDSELLQVQIESKKRKLGSGVWLCLMIIISFNVNAQYLGVNVLNKGIGVNAGILVNKLNIQAALTSPIMNLENSNTYSLSAGYQFNITNRDDDNYSFTPSIGAALVKSRRWDSKAAMTTYEQMKIMYGAELGKDAFMGRVFISVNYSDALYYSVGMKVFFKR